MESLNWRLDLSRVVFGEGLPSASISTLWWTVCLCVSHKKSSLPTNELSAGGANSKVSRPLGLAAIGRLWSSDDDEYCIKDDKAHNYFDEDGEIMCTHWIVLCTHSPLAQSVTSLQLSVCHMTSHIMMMMLILTHRFFYYSVLDALSCYFFHTQVWSHLRISVTNWLTDDLLELDWFDPCWLGYSIQSRLLCWDICNIGNICTICKIRI